MTTPSDCEALAELEALRNALHALGLDPISVCAFVRSDKSDIDQHVFMAMKVVPDYEMARQCGATEQHIQHIRQRIESLQRGRSALLPVLTATEESGPSPLWLKSELVRKL